MNPQNFLQQLGWSEKTATVYLCLLNLGRASVRVLAKETGFNRGIVYEILKFLRQEGIVSFYHKEKKQYFIAEDPVNLERLAAEKELEARKFEAAVQEIIPELRSLHSKAEAKPTVKYYEGGKGVAAILKDVLETMAKNAKEQFYRVYSSADIRQYLYKDFPDFTQKRVAAGISVRVIALGEGGEEAKLAERKWLLRTTSHQSPTANHQPPTAPTYIIIYNSKTAFISLNQSKNPQGVIIEDAGVSYTQRITFDYIWSILNSKFKTQSSKPQP